MKSLLFFSFFLKIGQFLAFLLNFFPNFCPKNTFFVLKPQPQLFFSARKVLYWAKILINIEFKGQKLTNSQKKRKRTFQAKKTQLGQSLRRKKRIFAPKIDQFSKKKKKKGHFRTKKKAGAELKNQKIIFLAKNCEKN